jgi:AcrR family transcriptional regulator
MEEVARSGYADLSIERVASRAGVNRTTIYRRWPSKRDLVDSALQLAANQVQFDWDHGNLRDDLTEMVRHARDTLFTPVMLGVHRLMLDTIDEPSLQGLALAAHQEKIALAVRMLERAQARGELRPDVDKLIFLDSLMGTLFVRLVFLRERIDESEVARLVDHFVRLALPHSTPVAGARRAIPKAKPGRPAPKKPTPKKPAPKRR